MPEERIFMDIELFQDRTDAWRFRIRASNGEILVTSEAYTRLHDAKRGFKTLAAMFGMDHIIERSEEEL